MSNDRKDEGAVRQEMSVGLLGATSIWHWVILGAIVLILFGRGKISEVMGDVAKGVKSFKRGLADDETPEPARPIERPVAEPVAATTATREEQRR